ncbi:hypothetical protein MRB53_022348 [Persea americana]|uniref:Uncharacterized protein n=1 Tax=Persea americana TaxID=3435 RepID=A0ACC2L6H1_PERAE|nr:hypothetical protein MRB53_022348 [Persea americana]
MTEAPKDGLTAQVELDHVLEKNKKAIQFIEDVTSNADEIQKRVLAEILSENAHIEYLNRYNLDGQTDQESFKRLIPVVEYEDLQPDIERIANGDTSPILCAQPISELLISSGTSGGKSKLIPSTEEELERRFLLSRLLMPVMNRFVQGLDKGKALYFQFVRSESYTPGGLVARPVLTSLYKSKQFKDKPYDPYNIYTSPIETILCLNSYQSIYSQLLCGLCQNKQVVRMGASFATSFLRVIQFLEKNWTSLCNDIRTGTLDARITDHLVREAVMKILNPDPELEYELVVTTYAGLYRYRVGDVLRVAGFKNKAPQFYFVRRKNVILSIDADKTNEVELQNAVNNAIKHLEPFGASLIGYTSYADTSSIPGHYVLYWEICVYATPIPSLVFEACCLAVEESLNSVYHYCRFSDESIAPLEIKIVETGTFDKLMDYALSLGTSMSQYKTPLCVKLTPMVELLNSSVLSNYFSPKCPK